MNTPSHLSSTRNGWLTYTIFTLTYIALFLIADELHWHLPVKCKDLTFVDGDKSLVALTAPGGSGQRNYMIWFDNHLNQKRQERLASDQWMASCTLSPDGASLINVLSSRDGYQIEIRSTSDLSRLIQEIKPKFPEEHSKHSTCNKISLIGSPPSAIAVRDWDGTYLIDYSGRIISQVGEIERFYRWINIDNCFSSEYSLAVTNGNHNSNIETIQCYRATASGFESLYQERTGVDEQHFLLSDNGRLVIQDEHRVRVIDVSQGEGASKEAVIPWSISQGILHRISASGRILVFFNQQEFVIVSTDTGTVQGRLAIEPPYSTYSAMALSDDRLVYDRSRSARMGSTLVTFDWKNSSVNEYSLDGPLQRAETLIYCVSLGVLITWTGIFFVAATKHQNPLFGAVVLFAMLSLFIRWLYQHPNLDSFQEDLRNGIFLFVAWQVVLSLSCVLAFRYLPIGVAAVLTLCLATSVFFSMRTMHSSDHLWVGNAFLIAGVGLVVAFTFIAFAATKRRRVVFWHLLLLMAAIAVVSELFSTSDKLVLTNESEWPYHHNTYWPQSIGISAGVFQVLLTIFVCYLARLKSIWLVVVPSVLFICLTHLISLPSEIGKYSAEGWIILTTLAGSLVTLLLLNIYYLGFERTNEEVGT